MISTEAPVASAPALNARSIFWEVRKIAGTLEALTYVSILTSLGTELTALPPLVIIG